MKGNFIFDIVANGLKVKNKFNNYLFKESHRMKFGSILR
jgi:hypothetical protein